MSGSVQSRRLSYRQCEIDFQLELSRGASCIASCQSDSSLREQVEQTVLSFLETHGANRFAAFRDVLAARLAARGRRDAAVYVATYPLPHEATIEGGSSNAVQEDSSQIRLTGSQSK